MFSKDTAIKISVLLSKQAENEIKLLMDDLIEQQVRLIKENASDDVLRVIAVKIDFFEKFKSYRQRIEDVVKNAKLQSAST